MAIWILRAVFLAVVIGISVTLVQSEYLNVNRLFTVLAVLLLAIAAIVVDVIVPRKRIELISSVYFGIVVGLFLTYVVSLILGPLFISLAGTSPQIDATRSSLLLILGTFVCYFCVSILWQTKDDFRFIIPYVEFSKEVKTLKPYILDTSVVIDGRIGDLVETGILDNRLVMPRFILTELQAIADSSDKMRRARGRRGLDVLNRLRTNPKVDLQVDDRDLPEMANQTVDMKLVLLARHLTGKIVTGDFNLNKVARLQNVHVVNLNEIANSLKPVFLPGEKIEIQIVKPGEESGQGVGYLEDGTMIVIEDGRKYIGQSVNITVTSMLQTNAGRMVFGKYDSVAGK